jgi:ribosomal-protein-alanine N-acetyltransferase
MTKFVQKILPTLETQRLILKGVTLADEPAYTKHFVDYEVIQFLSSKVPWPYPDDGVKYFLEHLILPRQGIDRWCFGIYQKSNPSELIGCVDLWRGPIPENRGFWLGKAFWGQGLMTEATAAVNEYAFRHLGFDKLYFTNAVGNTASRRVKEKSGAKFLEVREAQFVNPKFTHTELWELSKESWEKSQFKIV